MVLIPVIVFIIALALALALALAILLTDFALQRFPVGLELSEKINAFISLSVETG